MLTSFKGLAALIPQMKKAISPVNQIKKWLTGKIPISQRFYVMLTPFK